MFQNIIAIYSYRILATCFLLATLCPFSSASTRHHVSKDNGGVQGLDSPAKGHFRSLRRGPSRQYRQEKDLPWWTGRAFGTSTTSSIISDTSSPVVGFATIPPTASPSLAPTLIPIGITTHPTASPAASPTIFPSDAPSVPPTTVQSMNSPLPNEEAEKLARYIFGAVFVGVYVLLGGGMAIRWLWR